MDFIVGSVQKHRNNVATMEKERDDLRTLSKEVVGKDLARVERGKHLERSSRKLSTL